VEFAIVGTMNDVAELMQHGVDDVLYWHKQGLVAGKSQTKTYLPSSIDIQACTIMSYTFLENQP
jgi:hypothetical protein